MSAAKKQRKEVGSEFFYEEDGKRRDAALHDDILGDNDGAHDTGRKAAKRAGLTDAEIAQLYPGKIAKDYDESKHPRDDHGRWTDAGGGDEAPAPAPQDDADMRLVGSGVDRKRVEEWRDDLQKQIDAIPKDQVGGEHESELYRLKVPLDMFLGNSPEEIKTGHFSLTEVHDGNNKLLAAVYVGFYPQSNVASFGGFGSIDDAAAAKALYHAILHEQEGNRAERIETAEFTESQKYIDLLVKAGFKKVGSAEGGVQRLEIGKEKTSLEKLREKTQTAEHAAMVKGAAQATAQLLGYDSKYIDINEGEHPFTIGSETKPRSAAGLAHLDTGKIELFPKAIWNSSAAVSVTAHEVMHQKYQTVLNAWIADRKLVFEEDQRRIAAGQDTITKPSGELRDEYKSKYPLYERFWKHDNALDQRIAKDGVSEYSEAYWKQAKPGTPNQVTLTTAQHETMAEIARLEAERTKFALARVWRSYYNDVVKTYDELKAAGIRVPPDVKEKP
jgi:hypothetical protein